MGIAFTLVILSVTTEQQALWKARLDMHSAGSSPALTVDEKEERCTVFRDVLVCL